MPETLTAPAPSPNAKPASSSPAPTPAAIPAMEAITPRTSKPRPEYSLAKWANSSADQKDAKEELKPLHPPEQRKEPGEAVKEAKDAKATDATPELQKSETATTREEAPKDLQEESEKKFNGKPFKLAEHYKLKAKTATEKLAKLEARLKEVGDVDQIKSEAESARKKVEQLSADLAKRDEILRHVAYERSQEFDEKHRQPWAKEWKSAMGKLKGLKIQGADGNERQITVQDVQALVEMEPDLSRSKMRELFPDALDYTDVKMHVERIRELAEAQREAIENHKKNGAEWEKENHSKRQKEFEQQQSEQKAIAEQNAKWFEEFSARDRDKLEHIRQKEGDEEWNDKLASAEDFISKSLSVDPNDPRLSKDERREAIERNTAVLNRAKAYSLLKLENKRKDKIIAEKDKIIAGYKSTEPKAGEDAKGRTSVSAIPIHPRDEANQKLRRFAA